MVQEKHLLGVSVDKKLFSHPLADLPWVPVRFTLLKALRYRLQDQCLNATTRLDLLCELAKLSNGNFDKQLHELVANEVVGGEPRRLLVLIPLLLLLPLLTEREGERGLLFLHGKARLFSLRREERSFGLPRLVIHLSFTVVLEELSCRVFLID